MRLTRYWDVDGTRVGEVADDDVVTPIVGISTIDADTDADTLARAPRERDGQFRLGERRSAPLTTPRRIVCVGLNYHAHVDETGRDLPTYPVLFTKFSSALVGADDDIILPPESTQVDYEGEMVVVIGRGGRRIPLDEALSHVLGYSVANDVTMRDYQYKTHQWLQGKAWDESTPVGPVLVTPDAIDLEAQTITTTVNGELMQSSGLDRLIFSVPTLVAHISEFTRLEPGDLILTGTPGGVGHRRDPQIHLKDGDVVTVQVSGIGAVRNTVTADGLGRRGGGVPK